MKLSLINQIWLEKTGARYGLPPEVLHDGIIRMLRERDESGIQKIEHWLNASEQAWQHGRALLEEIQKTRSVAEDAVEAVRLYCIILEQELKKASVAPT